MIQSNHTTYYPDERYHHQSEDRSPMDQHQGHALSAKQNPLYRDPHSHSDPHRRQHNYAEQQQQHHVQHQQHQHQSHQQQPQQHRQQQPYHPPQPHHSIQTAAAAVRQHSAMAKSNEDHHHTTPTHHYAIPAVQPSDPSFTQRPHSRSFSGTHQHSQYSHAPVSPPTPMHPQGGHRLHHSVSAGHLVPAGYRSAPLGNSMPDPMGSKPRPPTGPVAPPNNIKKKDPYATAWRTYSKIAEELDLLNPDGSLYPISKEAILKYLRHQSKRIKSSNLHWYVNGLKKHQENLGFPWDDIRYDDQVVALLKELTLHPVTIVHGGSNNNNSNGALNGNNRTDGAATAYGQTPDRQRERQVSSGNTIFPPPQISHYHAPPPAPIDTTTKIAGLSISQSKIQPPSQPFPGSYGSSETHRSSSGYNYEEKSSSVQMKQNHSNGVQRSQIYSPPTTKAASYHSAPIQLPSGHGQGEPHQSSRNQGKQFSPVIAKSQQSSPMSSSEIQIGTPPLTSTPRHQESKVERTGHLASPTSPGDEMDEDFEASSRNQSHEDQVNYQPEYMDEEPSERAALKRYASTGTLRNQSRASAISVHPYPRPSDHRQRDDQSATLSPRARENDPNGGSLFFPVGSPDTASSSSALQNRVSPLGSAASIGSNSPASRNATGGPIPSTPRHKRTNGVVSSPISTVAAVIASAATAAAAAAAMPSSPIVPGKQTVQFSEVAEVAQRLQTKYGNQCQSHPWGCVEISEDFHLELTIKMYMDWAGLVASQRLSMDELPDLPEFRVTDRIGLSSSPPMTFVGSGTLKRMTSTPSTITMGSFSQHRTATNASMKSEEVSPSLDHNSPNSSRSSRFGGSNGAIRKHRSPSRSPIYGSSPKEGYLIESLMSRIGSPPPTSFLPSPPAMPFPVREGSVIGGGELSPSQKCPPTSSGGGGGVANSTIRVRARRMASSPSLSQHRPSSSSSSLHSQQATSPPSTSHLKRGNSYGMASPPSLPSRPQFMPPMPPVPPLPSSLKVLRSASGKQYVLKSGGGGTRRLKLVGGGGGGDGAAAGSGSILSNSTASSEDMDLSANEEEDDETMMMVMDDEEERENGAGHLHRVRDSRPSRGVMSPSSSALDNFPSRNSMRHYEDKKEDLIMASSGKDETRQGDLEDEGEEEEDERRGDREDSRFIGRREVPVPADPLQDNNNNNNSGSSSIGRPDQDRLSGDDYFQSRSSPTLNDNNDNNTDAWPSRVRVEFDEDMEADSEVEEQEQAKGSGMHGSTLHHPNQKHQQQQQQLSRRYDNETSYDREQEKEQDEEGDSEAVSWEQDQAERERRSLQFHGMYQQQQKQQQELHSRHHSSNDRDEDEVEEVRMEFKSLHSFS
ncbi:MAG: hypothetical protein JOS17DRAFT_105388 [Linnemannia elongata]|nr:MAG: hypothetical protein JOS17DRAFT_105388 [Linnemannia elongata]